MSGPRALLFDIGNTRVKWGLLDGEDLRRTGTIRHDTLRKKGIEALTRRLPRRVDDALACNVAGQDFANRFGRAIGIHIGGDLRFTRSEREAYGLVSGYAKPRTLGVDRWIAMIGARAEFRSALCVVDAGTAITIDAIDRGGQHLGGQIIPGIDLMGQALRRDTSDIGTPRKGVADPAPDRSMFADGTDRAVAFGALNAASGAVERAIRALRGAGQRPKIVLTGGDASRILKQLRGTPVHRPNLVLQGLAFVVQNGS